MSNRETIQQALEALESGNPYHQQLATKWLRTALEQPDRISDDPIYIASDGGFYPMPRQRNPLEREHMTDLRQAAQQALEALQYGKPNKAITILREALEREHAMHELARLGQEIEQEQQAEPCIGKDPRCPCQDGDACHYKDCVDTKALPVPVAQPEQEPSVWRDMVVVSLVREGIDKHKARELADHFAAQPVQEPVAFYHPHKGFYWAKPTHISAPTVVDVEPLPLYAAPPAAQRPWQGLTDKELQFYRKKYSKLVNVGYYKKTHTNVVTEAFDSTGFYKEVSTVLKERNTCLG